LEIFQQRKRKNPLYSTHAFARDLGVSQGYVSLVLNGRRRLSLKRALQFAVLLRLEQPQARALVEGAIADGPADAATREKLSQFLERLDDKSGVPSYERLEVDRFRVISEWYHLAILDLTTVPAFQPDADWIARRLGISTAEARDGIDRLLRLELLKRNGAQLVKTKLRIEFPAERPDAAIRLFHQQMMEKALAELDQRNEERFARREISGMTMAINSSRLPEARRRIQRFQKELATFLCKGGGDALYQLNVQFFPLERDGDSPAEH
jgi:uncharacterized protein (TIGR02147 family)